MKIAICEDDKTILEYITNAVREHLDSSYKIYSFKTIAELDLERDKFEFDIYLLDIELGDGSGFDYAKTIRDTNKDSMIAFITEHGEYAPHGYQYDINGYVLKPINLQEIKTLIDRLISNIKKTYTPFSITENYKEIIINIEDIEFFEKHNRKTIIYTNNCHYEVNESIKSLLRRLNNRAFFQVNRSLVINTNAIIKVVKEKQLEVHMKNNVKVLDDSGFLTLNEYLIKIKGVTK